LSEIQTKLCLAWFIARDTVPHTTAHRYKRLLGDNHPHVANSLNNLAGLYDSQGRYEEAEPLYLEAINIATQGLGENHPHTQTVYQNYLEMLSQLPEAELRQRFPDAVVEMLKPKPPHP
jgi:tetratricopeptide (TPR) repeat protein